LFVSLAPAGLAKASVRFDLSAPRAIDPNPFPCDILVQGHPVQFRLPIVSHLATPCVVLYYKNIVPRKGKAVNSPSGFFSNPCEKHTGPKEEGTRKSIPHYPPKVYLSYPTNTLYHAPKIMSIIESWLVSVYPLTIGPGLGL